MNYKENLQTSLDQYEKLKQEFNQLIFTDEFDYIQSTLPFSFLKAKYLIDILTLHQETPALITFKSGQDAANLYHDIISFKTENESLLNHASFMESVIAKKEEINELVHDNPYLTSAMSIPSFGTIESIVKSCLQQLPDYNKLLNKKFRMHFIESCIACLPSAELIVLLKEKIILNRDLEQLDMDNTIANSRYAQSYEKNLQYLRELTGHTALCIDKMETKLVGTTFLNDDGSSRQEYLKELQAYTKNINKPITLTAKRGIFVNRLGQEEQSISVYWNDKCLGFIAKNLVAEIESKYSDYSPQVILHSIVGGGELHNQSSKCSFGAEISLRVYSKQQTKAAEVEKSPELTEK